METLERAEQLKAELDNLRPLDSETEARIMQKFRLDWNYHSNNIEGNSLTYGETKALILFGITAQGKPLKDHFEVTGHNDAINWVIDLVKGITELTEVFIRELHTLILKEDHYVDAVTREGLPTRKLVKVGKYKSSPNHVLTQTGEMFYFAKPEETPSRMQELIDWYRTEREKSDVNPIILAALFHYRFIRIHPFDDGNGRVGRIVMNFILMQFSYPPIIIKTEDKEIYYAVLRLADSDQLEPFIEYIVQNLIRSLEIMIRGTKGEEIEEAEDLDKEIAIIEAKLKGFSKKVELTKTPDMILDIIDGSILVLAVKFIKSCRRFDKFYVRKQFAFYSNSYSSLYRIEDETYLTDVNKFIKGFEEFRELYWNEINRYHPSYLRLSYEHFAFNRKEVGDFDYNSHIYIDFKKTKYQIKTEYTKRTKETLIIEKLYSEELNDKEIESIVKLKAKQHKIFIESHLNKKNI